VANRNLTNLEDLPNVGPAIAKDLRRIGVLEPKALVGRDPFAMFFAASLASATILSCWTRSSPPSASWKVGRRNRGGRSRRNGNENWPHGKWRRNEKPGPSRRRQLADESHGPLHPFSFAMPSAATMTHIFIALSIK
jgi:hypothetical protein